MAGYKKGEGGRPKGAKNKAALDIRELIDSVVSNEDWAVIIGKMKEKASLGDEKATKLLWEYKFGKPAQTLETADNKPLEHNHTITASPKLLDLANKLADR